MERILLVLVPRSGYDLLADAVEMMPQVLDERGLEEAIVLVEYSGQGATVESPARVRLFTVPRKAMSAYLASFRVAPPVRNTVVLSLSEPSGQCLHLLMGAPGITRRSLVALGLFRMRSPHA